MIGVVVWADTAKNKAVIWCEDQRDLAYYLRPSEAREGCVPNKGDLVEFETHYEGNMRIAENVMVLEAQTQSTLADALQAGERWNRRDSNGYRGAQVATLSVPERGERSELRRKPAQRQERESATILSFPDRMRA
ncbi:hypothetical protein MHM97_08915 [Epibacterium sp. Ofav1-8]|jgi:hypothetical protein|nr:hypothetical protein [Epibacterium sp. Ofav1-8]